MKERLKHEIGRKAFHLLGITVPIAYFLFGKYPALLYASLALLGFVFLEFIRVRAHSFFPISMSKAADFMERKSERTTVAATVYFCVAAVISIFFLNEKSVIIGLSAGLLSDTAAALFGVGLGKHPFSPGKTIEGTLAGMVVAAATAFLLSSGIVTAVALALVFLVFDAVELGIDDNFTIPLFMVLAAYFFEAIL